MVLSLLYIVILCWSASIGQERHPDSASASDARNLNQDALLTVPSQGLITMLKCFSADKILYSGQVALRPWSVDRNNFGSLPSMVY
jgi:hypothetical protein